MTDSDWKVLCIYTDESAYIGDRKVFEHVAALARDAQMAGATVYEALLGFGGSVHVHRRHLLENDRSLVIEIIDREDKLRAFSEQLRDIPEIGLIILEAVEVIGGRASPPIDKS